MSESHSEQREDYAVRLTLTPNETSVVLKALDLYMRLGMGQLDEIGSYFTFNLGHPSTIDVDRLKLLCEQIKETVFPGLVKSAYYSISKAPIERARVAYDIFQVLRHCDAHARMPGGRAVHGPTVVFDDPLFVTEHRPVAKAVGILDQLADIPDDRPAARNRRKPRRANRA